MSAFKTGVLTLSVAMSKIQHSFLLVIATGRTKLSVSRAMKEALCTSRPLRDHSSTVNKRCWRNSFAISCSRKSANISRKVQTSAEKCKHQQCVLTIAENIRFLARQGWLCAEIVMKLTVSLERLINLSIGRG